MEPLDILRAFQVIVYVGLGVLAFVNWRLRRGPAGWLALAFAAIALVVIIGRVAPPTETTAGFLVQKLNAVLIVAFPYLLHRFQRDLAPGSRAEALVATAVSAVAVVWFVVLPEPLAIGPEAPGYVRGAIYFLLVQWIVVSGIVAVRLWRAGIGEARIAQARMRALGVGAVLISVALLLAAFAPVLGVTPAVTTSISTAAALVFFTAFVPPPFLRALWRRGTETVLWEAERELATAMTPDAIGAVLLPLVRDALGADAVVLTDLGGEVLASVGRDGPSGEADVDVRDPRVLVTPLRSGSLVALQGRLSPYAGQEEEGLVRSFGTVADLALERAHLFEQERHAREQAEAAREELEALVYGLSHDLKSPVVSVTGYVELLRDAFGEALGPEGQEFLDRLTANVDYMSQLLNDLLELSRVGRVLTEPAEVDIGALAREVAGDVGDAHPEATIEIGELPTAWVNHTRARQLLRNLVENAVVHGGRPDVTVRVTGERTGSGGTQIVVADDGVGIPEEHHERVFGIFERLGGGRATDQTVGSGTGIGLAVCRRIVDATGGTIRVRDEEGPGAAIEVVLPPAPRDGTDTGPIAVPVEAEGTA